MLERLGLVNVGPAHEMELELVVYAHADGGFSVWDPARNYWQTRAGVDVQNRIPGYVFSPQEVWSGLTVPVNGSPTRVCKGLLDDWSSWIRERGTEADLMARVLGTMTVEGEPLTVGKFGACRSTTPRMFRRSARNTPRRYRSSMLLGSAQDRGAGLYDGVVVV